MTLIAGKPLFNQKESRAQQAGAAETINLPPTVFLFAFNSLHMLFFPQTYKLWFVIV